MNAQVKPPTLIDLKPDLASVRDAVLEGLSRRRRALPPWLFYDGRGSQLFERICEQPEYYPTRAERAILQANADDIAATLGPGCTLVELGSGSPDKARIVLGLLPRPEGYIAIDVSLDALRASVGTLAREFPALEMTGICADFARQSALPLAAARPDGRLVGFFPGSTIGNMTPDDALAFLAGWRRRLAGGGMLVGVDLVKDPAILDAAYNDAAGVTAAFNRNMLDHVARRLDCDVDSAAFAHQAFYDADAQRVEMHLVATRAARVRIDDRHFDFEPGQGIHTESSYKYTVAGFRQLAQRAGFEPRRVWTDAARWFSVHYLHAAPAPD